MKNIIDYDQAKEIAWKEITRGPSKFMDINPPMFLLEEIIDAEWAILFPWASKRADKENNPDLNYLGNHPVLVDLIDGSSVIFNSIIRAEDFSIFTALKNYASSKGYTWNRELEEYLNEQGCYPYPTPEDKTRKFPHKLIQYKPTCQV